MAIENILICPEYARGRGFYLLNTKPVLVKHLSVGNSVAITKGDCVMDDGNGGLALGTDGGLTDLTFMGVAAETITGVTADNTKCAVHMVTESDLIWVAKENGTLVATSSGEVFDLESKTGIDQNDVGFGTRGIGFHVLAVDTTNQYALGRFMRGVS